MMAPSIPIPSWFTIRPMNGPSGIWSLLSIWLILIFCLTPLETQLTLGVYVQLERRNGAVGQYKHHTEVFIVLPGL